MLVEIPDHCENVRVDVHQVMPNHVHGIVEIKEEQDQGGRVGTRHAVSPQEFQREKFGKPRPGTLHTIVRSFKSAATKTVHDARLLSQKTIWQSRFHDHIIRSDIEYFFIQRYIELNPVVWYLDSDNPGMRDIPMDELRRVLKEKHGLDDYAIRYFIDDRIMR